ncbi:hypothetical protein K2173_027947 [Erythroxylum novogranatense]|uniref:Kinesin motor domain-containing protein n=1 Tax=Erythroxylum novogranatense TaxID=1862640 RepID=A0AAV8U444_9ROSI|nr:hypothetical protein K2173_027947 [Erythroxylum novogranatense]
MEMVSPQCPTTVTVRRNPPRRARPTPSTNPPQNQLGDSNLNEIPSFPIHEILSIEVPQNPKPDQPLSSSGAPDTETLKVYLRIRPLKPQPKQATTNCHKSVWPKNPAAKRTNAGKDKKTRTKRGEVCISVNDSHSVRLLPPLAFQESKRIKSEAFEGFSHVFDLDASQNNVYEKMVKPLVDDFLEGKSGMLAALGPSGSGKTHTVFGTPREPGMVPLALQHIFQKSVSNSSRSFYMSIFEISSERGKVERVTDLSPDGTDLSIQQSTIKGLQEIPISDATQAESLIARAMFKRATAMTNTNSQSSRSQCIINIHSLISELDGELEVQPKNALLTIVDLAGAEREKRTGNQGSRLLESNFINNTSMVFGLCLRSLLEHQKNPKKPLQKHFQNSLLTRYLRDYMEGKRRMTLILTVKPGEEDYLDTSYLLRQASPYMNIKFNTGEEPSNLVRTKRHIPTLSTVQQPKRMKYNNSADSYVIEEGEAVQYENETLQKDAPTVNEENPVVTLPENLDFVYVAKSEMADKNRNFEIMQNFAKALWKVLKQYKEKLMVAERAIQSLNENIKNEKTRYLELEKEFEDFKTCCSSSKQISADKTLVETDTRTESLWPPDSTGPSTVNEGHNEESKCNNITKDCETKQGKDAYNEMKGNIHSPDLKSAECNYTLQECEPSNMTLRHKESKCNDTSATRQAKGPYSEMKGNIHSPNLKSAKCNITREECESNMGFHKDVSSQTKTNSDSHNLESDCKSTPRDRDVSSSTQGSIKPPLPFGTETESTHQQDHLEASINKGTIKTSQKSSNLEKPKRRLLPAKATLLRDITALSIEDDEDKPKGNRGGKKLAIDETKRTQGNISLMRILEKSRHFLRT